MLLLDVVAFVVVVALLEKVSGVKGAGQQI
jgi:hypothetical protein